MRQQIEDIKFQQKSGFTHNSQQMDIYTFQNDL